MTVLLYANGEQVTYESYENPHGQAGDVFLRIDPQVVLNPGDRIEWSGDLPEGKTQLWVRYACTHPPLQRLRGVGNARLKDSDRYMLRGAESTTQPQGAHMSNHPLNMVRLQLDVESMRHSVVHALVAHQGEIQKQVEAEISTLATNGYLEHKIKESVRRHLDAAISEAVKHAMSSWTRESPTVKQAIQNAVTDALWQTEKEP